VASVIPTKALGHRFELLDTLRFVAAFAVVGYHWLFRGIETGTMTTVSYSGAAQVASYGYLGVELFFMISGFVITISAHGKTASRFAVSRLVRLYPAFWVAVLITATVTVIWGPPVLHVTIPQVLANLTMAPGVFNQPLVDGSYWTLLNELIFYAMVFLFLFFRLGKWLDVFFPVWAVGMMLITLVVPRFETVPLFGNLFAFFAAGAILSTIQRKGWHWWQALGLVASFYVAVRYMVKDVARLNALDGHFVQSTGVTVAIICVFFLVMIVQTVPSVAQWRIPRSTLLGALTYPLYLLHAYLGFMFFNHFANDSNKWVLYPIAFLLIVGLAYGLHVLVERRPKKFWLKFFDTIAGNPIRWAEGLVGRGRREPERTSGGDAPAPQTDRPTIPPVSEPRRSID